MAGAFDDVPVGGAFDDVPLPDDSKKKLERAHSKAASDIASNSDIQNDLNPSMLSAALEGPRRGLADLVGGSESIAGNAAALGTATQKLVDTGDFGEFAKRQLKAQGPAMLKAALGPVLGMVAEPFMRPGQSYAEPEAFQQGVAEEADRSADAARASPALTVVGEAATQALGMAGVGNMNVGPTMGQTAGGLAKLASKGVKATPAGIGAAIGNNLMPGLEGAAIGGAAGQGLLGGTATKLSESLERLAARLAGKDESFSPDIRKMAADLESQLKPPAPSAPLPAPMPPTGRYPAGVQGMPSRLEAVKADVVPEASVSPVPDVGNPTSAAKPPLPSYVNDEFDQAGLSVDWNDPAQRNPAAKLARNQLSKYLESPTKGQLQDQLRAQNPRSGLQQMVDQMEQTPTPEEMVSLVQTLPEEAQAQLVSQFGEQYGPDAMATLKAILAGGQ